MSGLRRSSWVVVLVLAVGLAAGSARAATRYVDPAGSDTPPYDTPAKAAHSIQDAIDAAGENDTILVADGTYVENIDINKDGLTVISVNGSGVTTIEASTAVTPVVLISADGVTLGLPGQGFTIDQQGATHPGNQSGDAAVMVDGSVVGMGTVTIQNNAFVGNDTDEGILISPALVGGHLVIQNNTFAKGGAATYSFEDAIYFDATGFGGAVGIAAANGAIVDLLGNTVTDFDRSAIYFAYDVYDSAVNIDATSSFTAVSSPSGTTYGMYFENDVRVFSSVNITGTAVTDADYGVYVGHSVEQDSDLILTDVTVTDFHEAGVYVSSTVEELSSLVIDPSTFTGDGAYGFYVNGIYEGSTVTVENSEFSGFDDTGLYIAGGIFDGCSLAVTGNTITADAGGATYGFYLADQYDDTSVVIDDNTIQDAEAGGIEYGMYFGYGPNYGAACTVSNNTVTGLTYIGLEEGGGTYNGSTWDITGNSFTGHADGADYGIYLYEIYDNSDVALNLNTVTGFTVAGFYLESDVYDGSSLTLEGNKFTAHPDGAEYGMYVYYAYYDALTTIIGNEVTGFGNTEGTEYGFYSYYSGDEGGHLVMQDNTFTAHENGADYGFYSEYGFDYGCTGLVTGNTFEGFTDEGWYSLYCEDGSTLTMTGNTFTAHSDGASYGIDLSDGVDYGSEVALHDNDVTGFTYEGIYISEVSEGSELTMTCNTFTADPNGAEYGVDVSSLDAGSTATINDNEISGIKGDDPCAQAVYVNGPVNGSTMEMCRNEITAHADGACYGIYFNVPPYEGSEATLCDNDVSGFTEASIYFGGSSGGYGSIIDILGNNLNGASASRGIHFYSLLEDAMVLTIAGNSIAGFDRDGIKFGDRVSGSHVMIEYNTITGGGLGDGFDYEDGIDFDGPVEAGSLVYVFGNCIAGVDDAGLEVNDITDTSSLEAHQNDFEGTTTGIENEIGDADHIIDAENNWWGDAAGPNTGGAAASGEVDADPWLSAPPDPDGDGVELCDDLCPDTPEGEEVDADGCSCLQLYPDRDDDGDGVLFCNDLCPDTPAVGSTRVEDPDPCSDALIEVPVAEPVDENGCSCSQLDDDGDGVNNCIDQCPDTPSGTPVDAVGCPATQPTGPMCGVGICGTATLSMMPFMLLGLGLMKLGLSRGRRRMR